MFVPGLNKAYCQNKRKRYPHTVQKVITKKCHIGRKMHKSPTGIILQQKYRDCVTDLAVGGLYLDGWPSMDG